MSVVPSITFKHPITGEIGQLSYLYLLLLLPLLYTGWKKISDARDSKRSYPKFNGPKGLPFLGNILQLGDKQWLKYTEWHKTFGPVYRLNFAGQDVIVVGTAKCAADLMDRRPAIYSDRPRFIMATEILTGGMNLAFARYGDRWRRMRRAANNGLSLKAAQEYTPLQEKEAIYLLHGLLHEKGNIDPQLRRTAAATVLSAVYAYPPISIGDHLVEKVENYVDRMLKAALPGNYLVDIFPFMMYIPTWMAKWKSEGYAWFKKDTDMFLGLVDDVKTGLKDGTRSECFVAKLLDTTQQSDLDPVETAWLAGMMLSMASTLSFFILAMVLFPHVQTKLRAEVDAAVGRDRFPNYSDVRKLPYLNAVIKETLRWRPMGPLAVPHRSSQDDVYEGHFIPAGTLIFPNVWAMHHDESIYPDPEDFKPERFLAEDGVTPIHYADDAKDLGVHTFGFGRRSCIGYTVANNALALNAASIVFAFHIDKAKDASGNDITPDPNDLLDEGLAVRPTPFECKITPRSPAIVEMINAAKVRYDGKSGI
ncbi:cytochrome P450 [Rickenella mellea]|uniref:Cytochrome P450 n=1 Tax=Rickenella mellea TaxID=50990 RepID=A0A4Y7PL34_9AGAM|nr:cytochrome P450 [Rickenella mellea]